MNTQMQEEVAKVEEEKARAISAANKRREEVAAAAVAAVKNSADNDMVSDIEKKWQRKEKSLLKEIEEANNILRDKHKQITVMASKIAQLEKEQYNPRMTYLQTIEQNLKQRLVELCVSEERLETGFLCPRDLKLLVDPTTLSCCHTFCSGCVEEIRQENFNELKCTVCNTVSERTYRNEKLENLKQQFLQFKTTTQVFGEW
ncbi:hypothetical protein HDU91_004512 [Kappamyces sp. JEL0680]|nr:hypothetical protein HDU91_004512 [Kappamyces sp. JEL0680]